jgi:hypothetical protein
MNTVFREQARLAAFRRKRALRNAEPTLEEMFSDPIIQSVMARDRVTQRDLVALLTTVSAARKVEFEAA